MHQKYGPIVSFKSPHCTLVQGVTLKATLEGHDHAMHVLMYVPRTHNCNEHCEHRREIRMNSLQQRMRGCSVVAHATILIPGGACLLWHGWFGALPLTPQREFARRAKRCRKCGGDVHASSGHSGAGGDAGPSAAQIRGSFKLVVPLKSRGAAATAVPSLAAVLDN